MDFLLWRVYWRGKHLYQTYCIDFLRILSSFIHWRLITVLSYALLQFLFFSYIWDRYLTFLWHINFWLSKIWIYCVNGIFKYIHLINCKKIREGWKFNVFSSVDKMLLTCQFRPKYETTESIEKILISTISLILTYNFLYWFWYMRFLEFIK